jgi:hypothetical protein
MTSARTAAFLSLLALAACGPGKMPEAPPGAVERTADELDRNEAAELKQTVRRIEVEADARADDSKQRIKAIENKRREGN